MRAGATTLPDCVKCGDEHYGCGRVAHPERIADADPAAVPGLLAQLAAAQAQLTARLLESPPDDGSEAGAGELLRVEEAAERLNDCTTWLYRRTGRLPFVVRLDGHVRVSAGLERYLRALATGGST